MSIHMCAQMVIPAHVGVVVMILSVVVVMVMATGSSPTVDQTPFEIVDAANRAFEYTFNNKTGQDVCSAIPSFSSPLHSRSFDTSVPK
jgi:hypothetical protein